MSGSQPALAAPGDFAFSDASIDREGERREDQDWIASLRQHPGACALRVADDGRVQLGADGASLARVSLPEAVLTEGVDVAAFLGLEDSGAPLFLIAAGSTLREAGDVGEIETFTDLRTAAATLRAAESGLAAYARSLLYWQSRARFCGRCGHPTAFNAAGHRATCGREVCGDVMFPRTDAAVIVLVEHAGRALLGRQASWGAHRFSTLAGFVEPGETLEDAVRREVHEETAIRVGVVTYLASQPWPFPASLMIGFRAQALTDSITVGDEIVEARWFSPEDIDLERRAGSLRLSPRLSISRWLLGNWYRESTGRDLAD